MHAGIAVLLHVTAGNSHWALDPGVALPLAVGGFLYARGARALGVHSRRDALRRWRLASFWAGWTTVALALLSPLHAASEQLFSMHMVQHELLMVVAAPLLVLGRPAMVVLWAFPLEARKSVAGVTSARPVRAVWTALVRPVDAWLLHGLVIWCWHVPFLFQATLHSEVVHAAQHLCFLGSALLFWWAIIYPPQRAALGMSIVYLFTTTVHTGALGALMALSRSPWYPEYAAGAAAWGVAPLTDQQAAGLIMWIPASVAYLVAALLIARQWLMHSEWRVAQRERASVVI